MAAIPSRWLAKSCALIAALVAVLAAWFLRRPDLSFGVRLFLSLAPILPMVFYFRYMVSCLRGCDELIRKIQLEGIFVAFIGMAMLTMTFGLLVQGRILPDVSMASLWPYAWMAMFLLWGLGSLMAARRYR